jgi:hypothetical protein
VSHLLLRNVADQTALPARTAGFGLHAATAPRSNQHFRRYTSACCVWRKAGVFALDPPGAPLWERNQSYERVSLPESPHNAALRCDPLLTKSGLQRGLSLRASVGLQPTGSSASASTNPEPSGCGCDGWPRRRAHPFLTPSLPFVDQPATLTRFACGYWSGSSEQGSAPTRRPRRRGARGGRRGRLRARPILPPAGSARPSAPPAR